jgi:hypothetical protein
LLKSLEAAAAFDYKNQEKTQMLLVIYLLQGTETAQISNCHMVAVNVTSSSSWYTGSLA